MKSNSLKHFLAVFIFILSINTTFGQKSLTVDGYVKALGTFSHLDRSYIPEFLHTAFPESSQDYQIHNRLNFRWYGNKGFSAVMGMRNQLYWGYQVNNVADYGSLIEDNGYFNLSTYWQNENTYLRTFIDRLYLQWQNDQWKLRVGRQRINWGINTTFNPNDLFNQYNYFDFDYEERPGVDAILVEKYLGSYSSIQAAYTPGADTITHSVGALLYKINRWNYDWQFLTGYYRHDIAIGGGWAGNLKNSGFKGEFTQFIPIDPNYTDPNFVFSTSWDYSFKNSIYLQLAWLFNDNGTLSPNILDQIQLVNSELSAKNIFPYKHTLMASVQYPFTALLSGSIAWIQTPDLSNAYAVPQISYSISQNLEALILAQIFLANNTLQDDEWGYFSSLVFVRFKYSF
jgi:hypothetical protein